MKRVHLGEDIKPVTKFRANAATLIEGIRSTKRALVLTQRGHSAAVVLDVGKYERIIEELELLRDIYKVEEQLAGRQDILDDRARERVLSAVKL